MGRTSRFPSGTFRVDVEIVLGSMGQRDGSGLTPTVTMPIISFVSMDPRVAEDQNNRQIQLYWQQVWKLEPRLSIVVIQDIFWLVLILGLVFKMDSILNFLQFVDVSAQL
jgi:hypothetical protein